MRHWKGTLVHQSPSFFNGNVSMLWEYGSMFPRVSGVPSGGGGVSGLGSFFHPLPGGGGGTALQEQKSLCAAFLL